MLKLSALIPAKLCPFSMLLQRAILCQPFSTIAKRVCGKPDISNQSLTKIFKTLSGTLEQIYLFQLVEVENFLKFVYYGEVSMESLMLWGWTSFNVLPVTGSEHFPRQEMVWLSILNVPASRMDMWIDDVDFTDPTHWDWRFIDNKYIPKWHDSSHTVDVNYLTQVCKKGLCKNCKRAKYKVNCVRQMCSEH